VFIPQVLDNHDSLFAAKKVDDLFNTLLCSVCIERDVKVHETQFGIIGMFLLPI